MNMSTSINTETEPVGPSLDRSETTSQTFSTSLKEKDDNEIQDPDPEKGPIEEPSTDAGDYPQGMTLFLIVLALSLGTFMNALDNTIVATAIPRITDEFHGLSDVTWYGSAYFMTAGGVQPLWGKAYKYFPLKTIYLVAFAVFEVGSLVCAATPTSVGFIIGRAIAGIGAGGIGAGSYTLLAFSAPPKQRAMFTGIIGAAYGGASVIAPLLGGAFTDRVTWRLCFYINLPIGAISAAIIVFFFKAPKLAKPAEVPLVEKFLQMDPVGVCLAMGAEIAFILAMQAGGQTDPWNSAKVIGLLVGFGAIVITFMGWEWYNSERAMIPPRLFKMKSVWVNAAYTLTLCAGFFTIIYYLPIYFQSVSGVSAIDSAVRNLPFILAAILASIVVGGSISKTGITTPLMVVLAAVGTVSCGLLYMLDIDTPSANWIGYQILAGVAFGGAFQIPIIHGQGCAKADDMSSTTAIIMFFQTLGASLVLSAAQAGFVNRLIAVVMVEVPSVSPLLLVGTGATEIRNAFPADQIPGIIAGYMAGLKLVFAVVTGSTGLAFVFSLFGSWKRLDPKALEGAGAAA